MNQPVDLYSLQLIRLVAEHRNFSAAAKEAGISQSALSRQIANAELRLELKLFERTTRQVKITEAGAILLRETAAIPNLLEGALNRLREECLEVPEDGGETRADVRNAAMPEEQIRSEQQTRERSDPERTGAAPDGIATNGHDDQQRQSAKQAAVETR